MNNSLQKTKDYYRNLISKESRQRIFRQKRSIIMQINNNKQISSSMLVNITIIYNKIQQSTCKLALQQLQILKEIAQYVDKLQNIQLLNLLKICQYLLKNIQILPKKQIKSTLQFYNTDNQIPQSIPYVSSQQYTFKYTIYIATLLLIQISHQDLQQSTEVRYIFQTDIWNNMLTIINQTDQPQVYLWNCCYVIGNIIINESNIIHNCINSIFNTEFQVIQTQIIQKLIALGAHHYSYESCQVFIWFIRNSLLIYTQQQQTIKLICLNAVFHVMETIQNINKQSIHWKFFHDTLELLYFITTMIAKKQQLYYYPIIINILNKLYNDLNQKNKQQQKQYPILYLNLTYIQIIKRHHFCPNLIQYVELMTKTQLFSSSYLQICKILLNPFLNFNYQNNLQLTQNQNCNFKEQIQYKINMILMQNMPKLLKHQKLLNRQFRISLLQFILLQYNYIIQYQAKHNYQKMNNQLIMSKQSYYNYNLLYSIMSMLELIFIDMQSDKICQALDLLYLLTTQLSIKQTLKNVICDQGHTISIMKLQQHTSLQIYQRASNVLNQLQIEQC